MKTVVPVGGCFRENKRDDLHNQQDEFDELLRLEFRALDTKRPQWLKQRRFHIWLLVGDGFSSLFQGFPASIFITFQWPHTRAGALTAKEMEPLIAELKVLALPSKTFTIPRLARILLTKAKCYTYSLSWSFCAILVQLPLVM